jgi:hypothetical protein
MKPTKRHAEAEDKVISICLSLGYGSIVKLYLEKENTEIKIRGQL